MNTKLICLIIAATIALAASASFCLAQDIQYQEAVITLPSGNRFNCEIADSVFKRSVGLKYHKELEPGTGMLFVYPYPSRTSFWMPPEMTFSIDMIFLDHKRRVVHIAHSAFPCKDPSGTDCESYSPERSVSFVIEIPAGEAKKNNLKKGNLVRIKYPAGYKFPKD